MSDTNLRVRSVSEIVDASFALYRRNALQYIVITAVATGPQLILSLLLLGGRAPTTTADIVPMIPVYILSFVTYTLVAGVIIRMGSDVYLGQEPDVARTVKFVLPKIPALLGVTLITALLAGLSVLFFILPVFYVIARFFAAPAAIVLENKGVFSAMGRASVLSDGRKWPILGTLALVWGIFLLLSVAITLLVTMLGNTLVLFIVNSLFSILVNPILYLATMVLYYDLRIRKEGFDVEQMSRALGSSSMSSPMTVPAS